MKILLFGASGKTGREILRKAHDRGHEITAFVRDPKKLVGLAATHIIQGDISDVAAVSRAVTGHAAVLSTLGAANPMRPYPAFRMGVENLVQAMESADVRRLVYLSFLGVRSGHENLGFFLNHVASRLLRCAIADHVANEARIRASRLAWTIIHAAKLTNGPATEAYRTGEQLAITSIIPSVSRADVADFMLRQVVEEGYRLRSPRIMN